MCGFEMNFKFSVVFVKVSSMTSCFLRYKKVFSKIFHLRQNSGTPIAGFGYIQSKIELKAIRREIVNVENFRWCLHLLILCLVLTSLCLAQKKILLALELINYWFKKSSSRKNDLQIIRRGIAHLRSFSLKNVKFLFYGTNLFQFLFITTHRKSCRKVCRKCFFFNRIGALFEYKVTFLFCFFTATCSVQRKIYH